MSRRAVAPVIGVSLLLAVTVALAALIGAFAFGFDEPDEPPQTAITPDREGNEVMLTHHSGDSLDVTDLTVSIFVNG